MTSEKSGQAGPAGRVLSPEFLRTVARQPGVYLMQDQAGRVIYVGKARDLRKRLASYNRLANAAASKTAVMLDRLRRVDTILTHTEKEALILEASLIKKHRPKYNIILRDDKNYPLLKVTVTEQWPRLLMTRRRNRDGSRYFGPFSSPAAMWETMNYLGTLFPLRRCKGKTIRKRPRPCLNYQMGRCAAPCAGKAEPAEYLERVRNIIQVLEGKKQALGRELEEQMKKAAAALAFEEAALYRDRLAALQATLEKQVVVSGRQVDQDVFGFCRQDQAVAVAVVLVRGGAVSGHQGFLLTEPVGADAEILAEVLRSYYGDGRPAAPEILLPFAASGAEALAEWLADLRGGRVFLKVPRRGSQLELLRLAETNARQFHAEQEKKAQDWEVLAAGIRRTLHLGRLPSRIACLDIANIGGEQAVGSLVSFVDGEKNQAAYRHYRIRSVQGPNDYAMMAEVLNRRFNNEKQDPDFTNLLPSLLVVDGGKGQLNIAVKVLAELGLTADIELLAIAKEKEAGQGERLYRPGRKNPIVLPRHSPVLLFFMKIRDEAHRFGITFHRRLRRKATLRSQLDIIPGVGPVRKQALLASLGSFKKIKAAPIETLAAVPGIGPELAGQIWRCLHEASTINN